MEQIHSFTKNITKIKMLLVLLFEFETFIIKRFLDQRDMNRPNTRVPKSKVTNVKRGRKGVQTPDDRVEMYPQKFWGYKNNEAHDCQSYVE